MAKRNWNKLKQQWLAAGCPKLTVFAKAKKIPYDTMVKQSSRHKWQQSSRELAAKTTDALAVTDAQRIAEFRGRLVKIGKGVTTQALKRLTITKDNSLHALRTGVKIEEMGVYGPARLQGQQAAPAAVQQNTVVFTEVMQVAQTGGTKEQEALAAALRELLKDTDQ